MTGGLEQQLRDEAEANRDTPLPGDVGTRPNLNRSTVYSVRLTPDEVAAVQAAAERAGLPPRRSFVRGSWSGPWPRTRVAAMRGSAR